MKKQRKQCFIGQTCWGSPYSLYKYDAYRASWQRHIKQQPATVSFFQRLLSDLESVIHGVDMNIL